MPDSRQPQPKRRSSSTTQTAVHPDVCTYRKKLDSVEKGACEATHDLDAKLREFLEELRTPIPPKPA